MMRISAADRKVYGDVNNGRTPDGGFRVFYAGKLLSPKRSQEIINHSPNGFAWGYGGSGPAQLALSILLLYINEQDAVRLYQDFKWDVIAKLDEEFELFEDEIINWLHAKGVEV